MPKREDYEPPETAVDKRRQVRVATELAVTFAFAGDGPGARLSAVTRDISHGGACLAVSGCTEELLGKLAKQPLLTIWIDRAFTTSLQGCVEWVRLPKVTDAQTLIGLEFHNLSAMQELVIIDVIAHALIDARVPSSSETSPLLV